MGVYIVTGASSGIGWLTTAALAARGDRVYGTRRRDVSLPEGVIPLTMDVADRDSVFAAIDEVVATDGRIDGVVNNAGIAMLTSFEDTTPEAWNQIIATNLSGPLWVSQAVLPTMRAAGRGAIVNVGSICGVVPFSFYGAYCATKYGLEAMTLALAAEVRSFGVRVCSVQPGSFRTAVMDNAPAPVEGTSVYAERNRWAHDRQALDCAESPEPHAVVEAILDALDRDDAPVQRLVGADAIELDADYRAQGADRWVSHLVDREPNG